MSNPAFERALNFVLMHEGGWCNDPRDPGGATNMGISLRFASTVGDMDKDGRLDLDLDGDGDVDIDDIRKLDRHQAEQAYRVMFWEPLRCDEIAPRVALMVFDTGVNQGRGAAVSILQAALGVAVDGKMGAETMGKLNLANPADLVIEFTARRMMRYAATKNFDVYGRGWSRRAISALMAGMGQ